MFRESGFNSSVFVSAFSKTMFNLFAASRKEDALAGTANFQHKPATFASTLSD